MHCFNAVNVNDSSPSECDIKTQFILFKQYFPYIFAFISKNIVFTMPVHIQNFHHHHKKCHPILHIYTRCSAQAVSQSAPSEASSQRLLHLPYTSHPSAIRCHSPSKLQSKCLCLCQWLFL